jgi:hypothetical protein
MTPAKPRPGALNGTREGSRWQPFRPGSGLVLHSEGTGLYRFRSSTPAQEATVSETAKKKTAAISTGLHQFMHHYGYPKADYPKQSAC